MPWRTASRIAASACGVCARSTAAVRTPPRDSASNTRSADDTRHTIGSSRTSTLVKPIDASTRPVSAASLNRKNGGPSGNGTLALPCFSIARNASWNATACSDQTVNA